MQIYLIKTNSESGHSHDWGGEFYYDKDQAIQRAKELTSDTRNAVGTNHFYVVEAELIETHDRDDNTITIAHVWCIDDVYTKAEEMGIRVNNIQAGEVLDFVNNHIDCELGVSWDTIENAIEEIAF